MPEKRLTNMPAAGPVDPPPQRVEKLDALQKRGSALLAAPVRLPPLSWTHPVAKNIVLMLKGDSNGIFCSRGIVLVGTCPPRTMYLKYIFFDRLRRVPWTRRRRFVSSFSTRQGTPRPDQRGYSPPYPPCCPGRARTAWYRAGARPRRTSPAFRR